MLKKIAIAAATLLTYVALVLACLTVTACPPRNPGAAPCQPPQIDCTTKDGQLKVTVTPTVRYDASASKSSVTLKINVTCGGTAVKGAQVCITYPGGKDVLSGATDGQGNVTVNQSFPADVRGGSGTVVAKGTDGNLETSFTLPK